jgi:hypothetical protein
MVRMLIRLCALATCLAPTTSWPVAMRTTDITAASAALLTDSPLRNLQGVVIARVRDCGSRLDFTHVFERPVLERMSFQGIVLLDANDDESLTRLRRVFSGLKLDRADRNHKRLLATVEAAPTPILFLFTPDMILRMALQAPMTAREADRLMAWLVSSIDQ